MHYDTIDASRTARVVTWLKGPVEIAFAIAPDHAPVRDNVSDSGDEEFDRNTENAILARLHEGDEWAWCTVRCQVRWNQWTADDHLGMCSYKDWEDFKQNGYYEDMIAECLLQLRKELTQMKNTLNRDFSNG